ncbi:MAG: hypothetical protein S4CHLAM45_10390 [Chlamydiales bacterium]|nr:hypothetical protein [Chlamydiales bacterium]MCH9619533.1 hypothetical protein [Chlamydiales bacterium]MCH9623139.1 hypothetical protein [Chlamydiales bacterium]
MIASKKGPPMAEEKKTEKKKRPTALKRDITNEKKRLVNKAFKSKVHTAMRNFQESLKENDPDAVQTNLSAVYSLMDKGVKRGIFKKNKASRTKLRSTKQVSTSSS